MDSLALEGKFSLGNDVEMHVFLSSLSPPPGKSQGQGGKNKEQLKVRESDT